MMGACYDRLRFASGRAFRPGPSHTTVSRRAGKVYLDALGTERIPDPTTDGDFCRRLEAVRLRRMETLMDAILALSLEGNETRVDVWWQQDAEFFDEAVIDRDGPPRRGAHVWRAQSGDRFVLQGRSVVAGRREDILTLGPR